MDLVISGWRVWGEGARRPPGRVRCEPIGEIHRRNTVPWGLLLLWLQDATDGLSEETYTKLTLFSRIILVPGVSKKSIGV